MILTSLLISGGAVATSVKVYRDKKREREFPWTVAAERLARKQKSGQRGLWKAQKPLHGLQIASSKGAWDQVAALVEPIRPLLVDPRHEQLKELASESQEGDVNEGKTMSKVDRDLIISSLSVGFATAGALFYSPLSLLSVPGLLWITLVNCEDAYHGFKSGRGISIYTLSALFSSGTILTGAYFAGSLGAFLVRLSKKLLVKTEDHSIRSLINVFGDQTRFVWLLKACPDGGRDSIEIETPVDALCPGDVIVVHAGETIPVDGQITFGTAAIDQRILTGESQPTQKEVGDQVFASTIVLSGKILIEVEKAGASTLAAEIGEILNQTKEFKNEMLSWGQGIADNSARTTIALSALFLPFLGATAAVTVLNASFGIYMMALGPLSMLSFLNLAGHAGILIKDGRSLQLLTEIDTVVFDKTGTLTQDVPHVGQLHTLNGVSEDELLTVAAAAEYKQTHPIALAIREAASSRDLSLPEISEANVEIGYGLKVSIANNPSEPRDTRLIRVGSARFMALEGINIPCNIQDVAEVCQENGYSLVYVAINDQLAGAIELHATIRPEARDVINELRKRKMEMVIISGDHEQPTRKLAQELGIDNYFAETLPENKAELIAKLQEQGKSVCFVGDGINDSIALKKANVSVSLRGASSAATDTAQIVLMNQDLTQLISAFDVAQNYKKNMKFNITTSTLPGVITLFGTLFLGFGVVHSVILNGISLTVGASNAAWPFLREQRTRNLSLETKPHPKIQTR